MSDTSQTVHNLLTQIIGLMNFLEDNDMSDAGKRAIANDKLDALKTNLEINADKHLSIIEALAHLQIHRGSHPELSGWFEKLHDVHAALSHSFHHPGYV
jgi:hypothetical protein